ESKVNFCSLALLAYNPGSLEGFVGAVFVESAKAFSRKGYYHCAVKLRDENTLFLKVGLLAYRPRRVKFGSTNTVAVATGNLRAFFCNWANLGHIFSHRMVS